MKQDEMIVRTCPKCGKTYRTSPAVSRVDGRTLICPECGTKEALDSMGLNEIEQQKILRLIADFTH